MGPRQSRDQGSTLLQRQKTQTKPLDVTDDINHLMPAANGIGLHSSLLKEDETEIRSKVELPTQLGRRNSTKCCDSKNSWCGNSCYSGQGRASTVQLWNIMVLKKKQTWRWGLTWVKCKLMGSCDPGARSPEMLQLQTCTATSVLFWLLNVINSGWKKCCRFLWVFEFSTVKLCLVSIKISLEFVWLSSPYGVIKIMHHMILFLKDKLSLLGEKKRFHGWNAHLVNT